jgi:hypothetical protein
MLNAGNAKVLLLHSPAQGESNDEKDSRRLEIVQYERHCAVDYTQAQGEDSRVQKVS